MQTGGNDSEVARLVHPKARRGMSAEGEVEHDALDGHIEGGGQRAEEGGRRIVVVREGGVDLRAVLLGDEHGDYAAVGLLL